MAMVVVVVVVVHGVELLTTQLCTVLMHSLNWIDN